MARGKSFARKKYARAAQQTSHSTALVEEQESSQAAADENVTPTDREDVGPGPFANSPHDDYVSSYCPDMPLLRTHTHTGD